MESEDWKEQRALELERKARRRATETDTLLTLREDGFKIEAFTLYHFRVNDVLDIFPTAKKYHAKLENKRGRYNDVLEFVTNYFNQSNPQQ